MKLTKVLAVAAIAGTSTAAYAGNVANVQVEDQPIIITEPEVVAGSSMGSLGGVAPALIALLLLGAVAAGSGS